MKTKFKQLPKKIALRLLIDNIDNNNDYLLLLAQWNKNEDDWRRGIISRENYELSRNKAIDAFNYYVDKLSDSDLAKVVAASTQSLKVKRKPKAKRPVMANKINVKGDDNIVISGVEGGNININIQKQPTPKVQKYDVKVPPVAKPRPVTAKETQKQIVLFLAANPSKNAELNLRVEHSIISEELEEMSRFDFVSKFSVSMQEMNMEVVGKQPQILHFSGHGLSGKESSMTDELGLDIGANTGLVFHNDEKNGGEILSVEKSEKIFQALKMMVPQLEIVILNTCYSEEQAIAISKNDIYTIGTNNSIFDEAAIAFSQGFYWRYAKTGDIISSVLFGKLQANTEMRDGEDVDDLIHLFYKGERIDI